MKDLGASGPEDSILEDVQFCLQDNGLPRSAVRRARGGKDWRKMEQISFYIAFCCNSANKVSLPTHFRIGLTEKPLDALAPCPPVQIKTRVDQSSNSCIFMHHHRLIKILLF